MYKFIKLNLKNVLIAFLGLLLINCSEEGIQSVQTEAPPSTSKEVIPNDPNFVDKETAMAIAQNLYFPESIDDDSALNLSARANATEKSIQKITSVSVDDQHPLYYVMNYDNGGFAIIAGDKRINPILAYSETGSFNYNPAEMPPALVDWLAEKESIIQFNRTERLIMADNLKDSWNSVLAISKNSVSALSTKSEVLARSQFDVQAKLIINYTWDQGCGWNKYMRWNTCNFSCNRYLVGCSSVAISMAMRYYKYANVKYNWDKMEAFKSSDEAARLLRDNADRLRSSYKCNLTSAYLNQFVPVLQSLGYRNSYLTSYSRTTIETNLRNKIPLVLAGDKPGEKYGHAWICDGFAHCYDKAGKYIGNRLHFNWGWGGLYNAWYWDSNFSHPKYKNHNYTLRRKIVVVKR